MKKSFEQGTAIVFEPYWWNTADKLLKKYYSLKYKELVYFLTDIPNVEGHCIVVKCNGTIVPMMHPDDFRIAKDEEL